MPELVFFRRGEEVLRVGVGRTRMVLGRGESSDVVIPDPNVSRQHVALLYDGTRCLLEDLSGQGTRVAGQPMKHGELPDGADLTLGPWRAVFRLSSAGPPEGPTGVGRRTDVQSREDSEDTLPPAQVRVKQGTTELVHELRGDSFTLGKDPSNALVIQDRFISSRHLKVTRREAGLHVLDLNSTNGTFLGARASSRRRSRWAPCCAWERRSCTSSRSPRGSRRRPFTASSATSPRCGSSWS